MLENSFMVAIPREGTPIGDPLSVFENLKAAEGMDFGDVDMVKPDDEDGFIGIKAKVSVEGRLYRILVYPHQVMIPDYIRVQHNFTEEEVAMVDKAEFGLGVEMEFSGDVLQAYQDQLKILVAFIPDILAVMDVSAEKILSGSWVKLAASSKVLPPPRYLFTAQAIGGDDNEVWIHTHGLGRCGFTELEILGSDRENMENHYSVLETMAFRMIEWNRTLEEGESVFLAYIGRDTELNATAIPWEKALEFYPKVSLGRHADRSDPYHAEGTSVIMVYPSEESVQKGSVAPLQVWNEELAQNPMFMISDNETLRMSKMARERIQYARKAICEEQNHVLIKLGLVVDPEYRNPNRNLDTQKEHLWFELLGIDGEKLHCVATQDAYYIDGLAQGVEGDYTISDVTDWIIYTPERRYYPDDAYALMRLKTFKEN